jgi:hypothetical protein
VRSSRAIQPLPERSAEEATINATRDADPVRHPSALLRVAVRTSSAWAEVGHTEGAVSRLGLPFFAGMQ